jgi:hypothetical protein
MKCVDSRSIAPTGGSGGCRAYSSIVIKITAAFLASLLALQPLAASDGGTNNVSISLSSRIVDSPETTANSASVIPGTIMDYSLGVAGPSGSAPAATGFAFGTVIPRNMILFVRDLRSAGSGPVEFTDGDSGLEFRFETLGSPGDGLEFSNNGGQSFDYVPIPDADGYDRNVTHLRIKPTGTLGPVAARHNRFSVRYRMKVK